MKKKNPTGVRFDEIKLSFVMEREKLSSPQQAVNFLLDAYWWQNKPTSGQGEINQERMPEVPKEAPKSKIKHSYEWYIKAISDLEYEAEYRSMHDLIKADENLGDKQKETLLLSMKNG